MTEGYYYVRDWWTFQHYKNRNPPWIKLHKVLLTSREFLSLTEIEQWRFIKLLVVSSEIEGRLPRDPAYIGARLGLYHPRSAVNLLASLESKGLISHIDIRGDRGLYDSTRQSNIKKNIETEKKVQVQAPPKSKSNGFIKPDISTIEAYMTEQGFPEPATSASKFFHWYESNGWRVGKNPMKSWKGAVITWKHNESQKPSLDWGSV